MSATVNLVIEKGSTLSHIFYYKDENRVAIDLTNYTARMQIRKKYNSTSFIAELTTGNGGIIITPLEGKIELYLADTATSALTDTYGVYDLELVNSTSGNVTKLLRGTVTITEEVTR